MTDSLLAEAGLLSPKIAGEARALDYLEEEQKRGITIKTANISLLHDWSGLIMGLLVIIHLALHWRWMVGVTKILFKGGEKECKN